MLFEYPIIISSSLFNIRIIIIIYYKIYYDKQNKKEKDDPVFERFTICSKK